MSTADKIESVILKVLGVSVAVWGVRVLKAAAERKAHEDYYSSKGAEGIGAAERIKRRIYKEISLAQDAGIDFSKDYSEFTDEEIATLEDLGREANWEQKEQKPYAQAYYESLQKAYSAISGVGIGKAYDIKDHNGNIVLTWIEDAASHVAHEREILEKQQRTIEADARAAEARKRLQKTRRQSQQLSMFGCGYADTPNYSLSLLNRYISSVPVTDVQVVLNDKNKHGHYYILCGDAQGGRDFYLSGKNLPYFRAYCERNGIEYDEFYLPDDVISNTPDVEHELWEIWREKLEYGDTDLDYDVWRRIYGDEYLESSDIRYM